jgi:hypothetical protein
MGTLTAEEHRLIANAVAKGRVTRVPIGKSALAPEYRWNGTSLEVVNPSPGRTGFHFGKSRRASPAPCPVREARNARVLELVREGLTKAEIVQRIPEIGAQTVYLVARRAGLTVARESSEDAAMTARIVELADGHRSLTEIARLAGCSRSSVRVRRDRLGLKMPVAKGRPKGGGA